MVQWGINHISVEEEQNEIEEYSRWSESDSNKWGKKLKVCLSVMEKCNL